MACTYRRAIAFDGYHVEPTVHILHIPHRTPCLGHTSDGALLGPRDGLFGETVGGGRTGLYFYEDDGFSVTHDQVDLASLREMKIPLDHRVANALQDRYGVFFPVGADSSSVHRVTVGRSFVVL